jgi:hypothetical protein
VHPVRIVSVRYRLRTTRGLLGAVQQESCCADRRAARGQQQRAQYSPSSLRLQAETPRMVLKGKCVCVCIPASESFLPVRTPLIAKAICNLRDRTDQLIDAGIAQSV